MKFTKKQRENVSNSFLDISKYAFGAIVVGKFISVVDMPIWVFIGGIVFSLAAFLFGSIVNKGILPAFVWVKSFLPFKGRVRVGMG